MARGAAPLFGLSNRPANTVTGAAMTALQPVPARLVDRNHRYHHAGRGGYDRLGCDVVYAFAGQTHRGEAESLRFGLIPTDARMDAVVATLQDSPATTAHVDPRHPQCALAFLSHAAFVPFTWGLFELQLIVLTLVMAAVLIAAGVRWRRAARA
jgi:hypothetical protein